MWLILIVYCWHLGGCTFVHGSVERCFALSAQSGACVTRRRRAAADGTVEVPEKAGVFYFPGAG